MSEIKLDQYTKLHELFDWVQEPDPIEERAERLRSLKKSVPEFVRFVVDYFNETHTFEEVLGFDSFDVRTVNPMNGHYSVLSLPFIEQELHLYADSSTMRTRIKHSKLLLAFDEMDPKDKDCILAYMRGELRLEKINLLVLSKAFPGEFQLGET